MGLAEPRQDPRLRDVLLLALGAAGTALCITLMYQGMRAVMAIGGACADGGPYVPVQPCPDGVAVSMVFSSFGLFLFGGIATWYGARVGGIWVAAPLLAWSGLFLSLGWNFIDLGIVNPPGGDGVVWGWAIPGVMFIVMGAVPLLFGASVLGSLRSPGPPSRRGEQPIVRTFPLGPDAGAVPVSRAPARAAGETASSTGTTARDEELEAIARDMGQAVAGAMAATPADPGRETARTTSTRARRPCSIVSSGSRISGTAASWARPNTRPPRRPSCASCRRGHEDRTRCGERRRRVGHRARHRCRQCPVRGARRGAERGDVPCPIDGPVTPRTDP